MNRRHQVLRELAAVLGFSLVAVLLNMVIAVGQAAALCGPGGEISDSCLRIVMEHQWTR
jgi:hypothetical protein